MATCDANYSFTLVDIGDIGRNSDGGVFSNSRMGKAFNEGTLTIPEPEVLQNTNVCVPYVLVGDEAFPLRENLMKPYPKEVLGLKERIYNYRLSRARRTIENAFGIAASRFRIFRRPIIARVHVVVNITKSVVALHNYLMAGKDFHSGNSRYCPSGYADTPARPGEMLLVKQMHYILYIELGQITTQKMLNKYVKSIVTILCQEMDKSIGNGKW